MTNEEAIKIIKAECYVFNPLNLDRTQMVNMALDRACKALEQEPKADTLDKIRAEINEYKSRQLTLSMGVDDLEEGKQIAIEYVLAIIDKYRESEVQE